MDKIIEQVFKIGDDEQITGLIIESLGSYWKDDYIGSYAQIILLETKSSQLIYSRIHLNGGEKIKIKKNFFISCLKQIDRTDFNDLLMLATTYPEFSDFQKRRYDTKSFKNEHLDIFLKETKGWLVYNQQLENLYMMSTGKTAEQAVIFRRRFGKQSPEIWKEMQKMKLYGTTMKEIILNRSLLFTYYPNYSGAYKLYSYFNC
jgi:hypothetical protein